MNHERKECANRVKTTEEHTNFYNKNGGEAQKRRKDAKTRKMRNEPNDKIDLN